MYSLKNHPYGAVTSEVFMLELIGRAGDGERIVLYDVNGLGTSSYQKEIVLDSKVKLQECDLGKYVEYNGPHYRFFFGDRNIGKSNNCNYIFLDKDDADDYLRFAQTNKDMIAAADEHFKWCDRLFRDLDRDYYDDYDNYD